MNTNKIYLTFDVDWVADYILAKVIKRLDDFGLKATFFATHNSDLLRELDSERFEIGLHPNFDCGDGRYRLEVLDELKAMYPSSVGMRSHTLFFSSRILGRLEKCGLRYESNIYLHKHIGLHPVLRTQKINSIPFNWSDDKHLELGEPFTLDALPNIDQSGINVFNFHPIHIYLNTDEYARYERAKTHFNKPELDAYINQSGKGIDTLFIELCEYLATNGIATGRLKDV